MTLTLAESVERIRSLAVRLDRDAVRYRAYDEVAFGGKPARIDAAAIRCVLAELAGLRAQVESEQAGTMELRRRFGANPTETFPGFVERIAAELEQTTRYWDAALARVAELEAQLAKEREAYATMSAAVIDATGLPVPAGGWTALEAVAALREVVAHWRRNADEIGVADGHALVLGWENLKTRAEEAEARAAKAEARVAVLEHACSSQNYEVCQTLGKALGYFWFKDDQKNFPDATEANGVCVGDHVAESIAEEAARRIKELEAQSIPCRLCHCCLDAPDRHGEILGEWVERAEAAKARVAELEAQLAQAEDALPSLADTVNQELRAGDWTDLQITPCLDDIKRGIFSIVDELRVRGAKLAQVEREKREAEREAFAAGARWTAALFGELWPTDKGIDAERDRRYPEQEQG